MRKFTIGRYLVLLAIIVAILCVLFARLKLGLIRYPDNDEFPYLNWAYHVSQGYRPYIDFFYLITPFYLLFTIPLVVFFHGPQAFLAARVVALGLTGILAFLISGIHYAHRKNRLIAILLVLTYLILPMPSDKLMEVRPDSLGMVFFLLALLLQIRSFQTQKKHLLFPFLSGVFFALSLLTIQKVLPLIMVSFVFILLFHISPLLVLSGFSLPIGIFTLWAVSTGQADVVFYSVTRLPLELSEWLRYQRLPVLFYFWPNNTYYGEKGYSIGNIANSLLWIAGIAYAIRYLILTAINRIKKKKQALEFPPLLMSLLLAVSLISYYFSLIRFPQYLIPSSLFITFFIGEMYYFFYELVKKLHVNDVFGAFLYFLCISLLLITFFSSTLPKFKWDNYGYLKSMQNVLDTVPKNEYLLDLDGKSLYYPYPYPFCCLPYPLTRYPSRKLPSLKEELIRTNTKYIYQANTDWIGHMKPEDLEYVKENFKPSFRNELWIKIGAGK